jgi:acyl-CoA reductase-like NAD-dependent aldehyde dehydrogenase
MLQVCPFLNGREVPSEAADVIESYNPATGRKLGEIPAGCRADVESAVAVSRANFESGAWRKAAPAAKKAVLYKWAELIEANARKLDALDAIEMGKPVSIRAFNASAGADVVRFNAEAIDKCNGDTLPSDAVSMVLQTREPRGVVAAIVPWNFPTYNVLLKAAPALAAGNSVVLKPSELANQSALLLARLAVEAGLPPGTLNILPGAGEIVGRALGEHMDVQMLAFTGSSAVGKLILQYAGKSNMKVVLAECGGKSPQIVFGDGLDLDAVATSVAQAMVLNQGQVCSVGSRLLVQDSIEELLTQKIIERLRSIVVGDPQATATTYGPLASREQFSKVRKYIANATEHGAHLAYGGGCLLEESGGYFIEPTVFVNVSERAPIAQEEIFGPVLSVMSFHSLEDAVRLANSTSYGLAAYVWTSQTATGLKLARAMQTAVTLINAATTPSAGPGHAFSGEPSRMSGVGIEGGMAGLESYLRRQTIWINHG